MILPPDQSLITTIEPNCRHKRHSQHVAKPLGQRKSMESPDATACSTEGAQNTVGSGEVDTLISDFDERHDGSSASGESCSIDTVDVRWQVAPAWRQGLDGLFPLRLDQWLRQGTASIVKNGPHRTVYRIDLPECQVYLKHYRCRDWLSAAEHLVRGSAGRREFLRGREIVRRQVPTVTPLAVGQRHRRGIVFDSFLVTAAVPDAMALSDYLSSELPRLDPKRQPAARREIASILGTLCATAHRAGIHHDDFHAGNILIRPCFTDDGAIEKPPEVFLIDVPNVRLSRPLGWRASRAALVMLRTSLRPFASRADCRRFLRHYLAARPELARPTARVAAKQIEDLALRAARRILRRRDRRDRRTNRTFYTLNTPHGTAHAVRDVDPVVLARLSGDPERLLRDNRHHAVKLGHGSLVVKSTLPIAGRHVEVAYKRSRVRSWWKALAGRLRRHRSLRAWSMGHALLARGIATPRPLAVCIPRYPLLRREGYLVTEWTGAAENLHLYLWRIEATGARRRSIRRTAESLGRLIGRMHFWHVAHRDLKGCNLLVAEKDGSVDTLVLDLDGVRIQNRLDRRAQVKDLARLATSLSAHLWVGRGTRVIFLKAYLSQLGPSATDWKKLWRETAVRSAVKMRRQRRRGQPIA